MPFSTPLSGAQLSPSFFLPLCFSLGTSKVVMALQRTFSLLLLLLLTLLELGLSSYGDENRMYQRFVQQHVDSKVANRNESYCDLLMQRRKMTSRYCRYFNTFIHEDIWKVINICSTTKIRCRNGEMNCHESVVNATDCRLIAGFKAPDCRYWAMTGTRRVVIACEGNPGLPVHFSS